MLIHEIGCDQNRQWSVSVEVVPMESRPFVSMGFFAPVNFHSVDVSL